MIFPHTAFSGSATAPADGVPVYIRDCHCHTAYGDEAASTTALAAGETALRLHPVLGDDENDPELNPPVPLALLCPMGNTLPPRWWQPLLAFAAPLKSNGKDAPWGSLRRPVFITGSNYGVDNLYAIARDRDAARTPWGSAHGIAARLREALGWGENIAIISHACVSAQLGLLQAQRAVQLGLADEALVFSFDFLSPFVTAGFHSLKILNSRLPQPYRSRATGSIALGDGMACAIVSPQPSPYRIGAQAVYNEMYHFTANDPSGDGFRKVLTPLAQAAGSRRLWVKGHGTGTLEAGELESRACAEVFGEATPLVSWKGGLGHTLGSCALVELAIAIAAHKLGAIPPTLLCGEPEGDPFAANVAGREVLCPSQFDATVLLSNAFGGAHAGMLLCYE